jgi:hypothetical protein
MKKSANKQSGQVVILTVALFIFLSLISVLGIVNPVLRHLRATYNIYQSKQSYYLAESGIEDAVYRLKTKASVPASYNLTLNGETSEITALDSYPDKIITATGNNNDFVRQLQAKVLLGTGISFHYGIQAGRGGFKMENSSSVIGNVNSNGSVIGSGNYIYGDVISSGASGLIYGIHATGTIYAHSIGNSSQRTYVDKDAYYATNLVNTTVTGTNYPNSADQAEVDLPISDEQIQAWESDAAAGGTISSCDSSGNYTISTSVNLGPKKITCNLVVKSSSGILTVTGPIWVTGNITLQTGPTIKMASSLGSNNVAIIADNPSNRSTSSTINIGQQTIFQGSGSVGSFVFLISQNNSAETGGSNVALTMNQGASALVAYASHGLINLSQSVSVKEVTAYKISLTQSANVTYDTGLPHTLFQAGPAGGYDITSWNEVE